MAVDEYRLRERLERLRSGQNISGKRKEVICDPVKWEFQEISEKKLSFRCRIAKLTRK